MLKIFVQNRRCSATPKELSMSHSKRKLSSKQMSLSLESCTYDCMVCVYVYRSFCVCMYVPYSELCFVRKFGNQLIQILYPLQTTKHCSKSVCYIVLNFRILILYPLENRVHCSKSV